jgi:pimeloyl-ACP methyl ester carboxylesterase
MDVSARLITTHAPRNPEGLVLVLHGGGSRRDSAMVSPTQLSVLRMVPIAQRIAWAGRGRVAVVRLLNSVRGWDTRHTPVDDVRWALGELREREGLSLPTCLVGHSLGGRAALLAGDQPEIRSIVALSTWVADPRSSCTGRTTGSQTRDARPRWPSSCPAPDLSATCG